MGTGIANIVSIVGLVTSLFSMGTSTVTQAQAMRQQLKPPAQVQQCPPGTITQAQQLSNGTWQITCLQETH